MFLLLGFIVFGVGAATSNGPFHGSVNNSTGANWTVTPSSLTSVTAKVSWNTSSGNGRAYVITGSPTCHKPSGVVVNASGGTTGRGSFSVTLKPGQSYYIYACNTGNNVGASFSLTYSGGYSAADLFATIFFVLGVLLLILAFLPRKPDPFDV